MQKIVKSYSATKEEIEIQNSKTLVAGSYNDVVPSEPIIFCDTKDGDIIIDGFSKGIKGQSITIIKTGSDGILKIKHEGPNSIMKIRTASKADVLLFADRYGTTTIYCDGEHWYCGEVNSPTYMSFNPVVVGSFIQDKIVDQLSSVQFKTMSWTVSIYSNDGDMRSSIVNVIQNGETALFTESATEDIGNTTDISLSVILEDNVVKLLASNSGNKVFNIKFLRSTI